MRRITQAELRALYPSPSPIVYDGVREVLSHLPEGKEKNIVKRKMSFSFILAAALVLISVTALAAGRLNLFRQTSERENPIVPLSGADELVVTNLGRIENDHAALTIEEAVYDGQGAMVLVRLTPRDPARCAMYSPCLQDAPDDMYEKQSMPRRVSPGCMNATRADGTDIEIMNAPDHQEMLVDGTPVEIPTDAQAARDASLPVFMDAGVMRLTGEETMEVTGRRDGRALIDYDLRLAVNGGTGDADLDGMLSDFLLYPQRAEGQDDGSALVWFNGIAETPMTDALALSITGTTTLDGQAQALDELDFTLSLQEPERRFALVPESDTLPGVAAIRSATINLTRVRGYFTIEYDMLTDDLIFIRPLDMDGNPLNAGAGWADSYERHCAEQYEIQTLRDIPETLTLEVTDVNDNVLARCVCRVVEDK